MSTTVPHKKTKQLELLLQHHLLDATSIVLSYVKYTRWYLRQRHLDNPPRVLLLSQIHWIYYTFTDNLSGWNIFVGLRKLSELLAWEKSVVFVRGCRDFVLIVNKKTKRRVVVPRFSVDYRLCEPYRFQRRKKRRRLFV